MLILLSSPKDMFIDLERKEEGERREGERKKCERKKSICCLSYDQESNLKSFCCTGDTPTN